MSVSKSIFNVQKSPGSIQFTFSSTMGNIDDVCEQTTRYLRSTIDGIDAQLFAINLVIREGLTNAVRHGNASDTGKIVRFLLTCVNKDAIKLTIEDEGKGFDWKKQQAAARTEDEDHGRGITIMDTYFSHYSYNDKGNILYLEKNISS